MFFFLCFRWNHTVFLTQSKRNISLNRRNSRSNVFILPLQAQPEYQIRHHFGGHGHSHGHSHGSGDDEDDVKEDQALSTPLSKKDALEADRITWTGVYLNIILSGMKGIAGFKFHSSGLLADAVHSMSDLVSDGITLLALKYCSRPPDHTHPYGYGKYETIGALTVSLLLVGGSLGIMHHSLDTLMSLLEPNVTPLFEPLLNQQQVQHHPEILETLQKLQHEGKGAHSHHVVDLHPAALGIALGSVISKEWLYRVTMKVGEKINSSVLKANAWHHRSDAVTSIVAMGGIGLSLAGFPVFDPIAGIAVGGIILKMGGEIGWHSIQELCDVNIPMKTFNKIEQAVNKCILVNSSSEKSSESIRIKHLRARRLGRHLHVDLSLVFTTSEMSLEQACIYKQQVKKEIQRVVPRVKDIIIELSTSTPPSTLKNQQEEQASTIFETFDKDFISQSQSHGNCHGKNSHSDGHRHGHGGH
jgi:cation diffusion facilitator family transporter